MVNKSALMATVAGAALVAAVTFVMSPYLYRSLMVDSDAFLEANGLSSTIVDVPDSIPVKFYPTGDGLKEKLADFLMPVSTMMICLQQGYFNLADAFSMVAQKQDVNGFVEFGVEPYPIHLDVAQFKDDLSKDLHIPKEDFQISEQDQNHIIKFVIRHEVAHIANIYNSDGAAHFEKAELDSIVQMKDLPLHTEVVEEDLKSLRLELQADQSAINADPDPDYRRVSKSYRAATSFGGFRSELLHGHATSFYLGPDSKRNYKDLSLNEHAQFSKQIARIFKDYAPDKTLLQRKICDNENQFCHRNVTYQNYFAAMEALNDETLTMPGEIRSALTDFTNAVAYFSRRIDDDNTHMLATIAPVDPDLETDADRRQKQMDAIIRKQQEAIQRMMERQSQISQKPS